MQFFLQVTDTPKGGHLKLADNFIFPVWILIKLSLKIF